jgi:LuxR family maltose regulon positive regulatory protein
MVSVALLSTKFYVPQRRPDGVTRPRLLERLNQGLGSGSQLTLISAPAGFGKTTLVSEWVAGRERPVAWLSLDEADNEPTRFLAYLVAALQTIMPHVGEKLFGALQSTQPPSAESILTSLLNEIAAVPENFMLVLDDYHVVEAQSVDQALTFLIEHMPPQMHLVIATREDPHLPLARLRAAGHLTELRAADLRFTASEAAEFLNRVMGLNLLAEDIAALDARTEGWIAGLQLAAISLQGHKDTASFVRSFTGSHHFVMDYLVEEVLQQQSESVQAFLLRTSILDRMCGPLCDAVLPDSTGSGQATLEHLEQANLFVVPLDNERRWYRYHHLFAELLRQRLRQSGLDEAELHQRAGHWYEDNSLDLEAFHHAAAANDVDRAERLLEGRGTPLHLRGGLMPALKWLDSLPPGVLDTRPKLWVIWASALLTGGQTTRVEEKLRRAEAALQSAAPDDATCDLHGQIAAGRAMVAVGHYDVETILAQASRALEYLHPGNLSSRFRVNVALANAYEFQGEHAALGRAYAEALSIAQASGNVLHIGVATIGIGQAQEIANQLHPAAESYRSAVQLLRDQPPPILSYAYLGLARILHEWNDLAAAERHLRQGLQLARQYDRDIDVFVICEVFLARLHLARGDVAAAVALLGGAHETARQRDFTLRMPEIAAAQVLTFLHQCNLAEAAVLAQSYDLPLSRARVHLAQGDPAQALAVLGLYRQQAEARGWVDERLRAMILQAVALRANGEKGKAAQVLGEAVALAEPGGFIRSFVDEGTPMAQLLSEAAAQGVMPDYTGKLLAAFAVAEERSQDGSNPSPDQRLIEPLSDRELEVLRLVAQGHSNHEISERLFLALSTVKGHNRLIFNKLQVQRRTEAVARARELGLL